MEYRFLAPEEYEQLRSIFEENDGDLPSPELSAIYAAFEGERLVGFQVLQYVPHAEPRWVDPEYRGRVNGRTLQEGIEGLFDKESGGSYYVFPGDERVAKLCRRGGMVEMPIRAWRKDILPRGK